MPLILVHTKQDATPPDVGKSLTTGKVLVVAAASHCCVTNSSIMFHVACRNRQGWIEMLCRNKLTEKYWMNSLTLAVVYGSGGLSGVPLSTYAVARYSTMVLLSTSLVVPLTSTGTRSRTSLSGMIEW